MLHFIFFTTFSLTLHAFRITVKSPSDAFSELILESPEINENSRSVTVKWRVGQAAGAQSRWRDIKLVHGGKVVSDFQKMGELARVGEEVKLFAVVPKQLPTPETEASRIASVVSLSLKAGHSIKSEFDYAAFVRAHPHAGNNEQIRIEKFMEEHKDAISSLEMLPIVQTAVNSAFRMPTSTLQECLSLDREIDGSLASLPLSERQKLTADIYRFRLKFQLHNVVLGLAKAVWTLMDFDTLKNLKDMWKHIEWGLCFGPINRENGRQCLEMEEMQGIMESVLEGEQLAKATFVEKVDKTLFLNYLVKELIDAQRGVLKALRKDIGQNSVLEFRVFYTEFSYFRLASLLPPAEFATAIFSEYGGYKLKQLVDIFESQNAAVKKYFSLNDKQMARFRDIKKTILEFFEEMDEADLPFEMLGSSENGDDLSEMIESSLQRLKKREEGGWIKRLRSDDFYENFGDSFYFDSEDKIAFVGFMERVKKFQKDLFRLANAYLISDEQFGNFSDKKFDHFWVTDADIMFPEMHIIFKLQGYIFFNDKLDILKLMWVPEEYIEKSSSSSTASHS